MSRISPKQYAAAFLDSIESGVAEGVVIEGLLRAIVSRGDMNKRGEILAAVEEGSVRRGGGRVVKAGFAHALGISERREFLNSWGKEDRVTITVEPELVAGVRILVNGESELDMSLGARLDKVVSAN
jgi:F0F1-type ATP synthase delta subunit